ncbi:MAG: NADH-quinone oxidoreductase subunit H [Candidatus Delongbacteria bacterium]|nr:NADH-quinone oxidoreductase subunit H [Candidatus Delongbacteria bacterium]
MLIMVLNILILLIIPFPFIGLIQRTKSWWAGRQGPSITQFFFDLLRLMRKGIIRSWATSFIFQIGPIIQLAAVLAAALLVPMLSGRSIMGIPGGFILFSYLLGLSKFMAVLTAMDSGSSFEGMGSNREALFNILVEPAFFILLAGFATLNPGLEFHELIRILHTLNWSHGLIAGLSALTFFLLLLIEGCRVPIDDPNTHLELTMIHEVMILDNSGPDLAILHYASALKMVVFSSLIATILIPVELSTPLTIILYLVMLGIIPILIGTIESLTARIRMTRLPQFLFILTSFSLIILSVLYLVEFGGLQ